MIIIIFTFGIVFGSFLNVCISRIPAKESLLPASHCPKCNGAIKPYDNIPVLSYLFLRGKCRHCNERISLLYPAVELLTGLVFLLLFYRYGLSLPFVEYAVLSCLLITMAFIDLKTQEIPDGLVLFGLIAGILFTFLFNFQSSILSGLIGFVLGGGLFLLIAIASKGGMGGGDIKLMAVLGLWLGWQGILVISLFSFLIGAVISVTLLLLKLKSRKDYIPFGPFIALAALLWMLFGNELLNWYMQILF